MNDLTCPWCELTLELPADVTTEQQCPECLTTWCYEEEERPLAVAA